MTDLVQVRRFENDAIMEIALNRADKHNALSMELITGLRKAVKSAHTDATVRTVIIAGVGKSFCAGMDLGAVRDNPAAMGDLLLELSLLLREIRRLPQPVIARVQGAAIGGGCGLMSVCDFGFTHSGAKVGYPEVDLGICPAVVAPWLVARLGAGRARQLLLAGGTFNGQFAFEVGLVTHVVDLDDLKPEAMKFAKILLTGGPEALATTKNWLNRLEGAMDDDVLDEAASISAAVVQKEEARTRLKKFFERSK